MLLMVIFWMCCLFLFVMFLLYSRGQFTKGQSMEIYF